MQFITVKQHNHEVDETIIHFVQWNGNEEELKKLRKLIELAWDGNMQEDRDYSEFECDTETIISETTVDEMIKLGYGFEVTMFQKHTGVYKAPKLADDPGINDDNLNVQTVYANIAREQLHKKYHLNELSEWFYQVTKTN